MNNLPHDMIRKIASLMPSDKDKASLESTSRGTRDALKQSLKGGPKGPKSYLTKTRGRYQRLYDTWDRVYLHERDEFYRRLDILSYSRLEIERVSCIPDLVHAAKKKYEKGRLIRFIKTTWRKSPENSVERDLYRRIRDRVEIWSTSGPYHKKYMHLLEVMRRHSTNPPTDEEDKDLGTYAMDAIIKESLLFFDKDIENSK